jgi:hypothetical protein
MNIFTTIKGNIGTVSNGQLLEGAYKNNLQFAYRDNIPEKKIRLSDIRELYDVGDLQSFVLKYPEELKKMFEKYKKEHSYPWANKIKFAKKQEEVKE